MTGFIAVDMLAEISKALECENDWTQLKDGVLECRLRDQYDGEHTGLARVTINKAGKVSVMAWSDNPYEYATMPDPDWTHDYDSADPEAIGSYDDRITEVQLCQFDVRVRTLRRLRCSSGLRQQGGRRLRLLRILPLEKKEKRKC